MYETVFARLVRSGLALLLCLTLAGTTIAGSVRTAAAQDDAADASLPGFEALPPEAELAAFAAGQFEENGTGTLTVERIELAGGAALDPVDGPFLVIIEQGSLVYQDDLGLEAEIETGDSRFFVAGEADTLTNGGDQPALLIRTSLVPDASSDDNETDDDGTDDGSDDQDDDSDADDDELGPGEDTPINPRGDDDDASAPMAGGVNALLLQETSTPDEVVISLTEEGFTPDEITLARGGILVIENAGNTSCEFTIDELGLSIELGTGDIEQATIDGEAGDYPFVCTDAAGDALGEGTLTIIDEADDDEPIETATPEVTATPDETPATDPDGGITIDASLTGVLLQATVELDGASDLFTAVVTLQPDGALTLNNADGSLGVIVTGGDLTVVRPGRGPALLRDGRDVLLPPGIAAQLSNNGDAPITLILAGVTGSSATAVDETTTPDADDPDEEEDASSSSSSSSSAAPAYYAYFPDDSELATLGLVPSRAAFIERTDPGSNNFWIQDQEDAAEAFTEWGWQRSSQLNYSSDGEQTEFGEVTVFGILIDAFEDEDGAAEFFELIASDPSGEELDFLDGVDEIEASIGFTYSSGGDTMIVAIHTDTCVITVFTVGPDLDTEGIVSAVTSLIFGVVG